SNHCRRELSRSLANLLGHHGVYFGLLMLERVCVGRTRRRPKSTGNSISELLHIESCGGGGFLRPAAVLTRTQVGRVPVPRVMFGVCLLVVVVVLRRFAEEFCKRRDVHGSEPPPLYWGSQQRQVTPLSLMEGLEPGTLRSRSRFPTLHARREAR